MTRLTLKSSFTPTGDQPKAIDDLARGIQREERHQVLLGVTGSGKSLDGREPVLVYREDARGLTAELTPIGDLCDGILGPASEGEGSREAAAPPGLFVPSFDPETGRVRLSPLAAVSRHAPESLFRLKTSCGREAILTGDHNVYARREGALVLLETRALRPGDELPLPARLLGPARDLPDYEGQPLTDDILRLLGLYLLSGGAREGGPLLLALRDDELEALALEAARRAGVGARRRPLEPLAVGDPRLAARFAAWCGASPRERRLPPFFGALSDRQLGLLLASALDRPGAARLDSDRLEWRIPAPGLASALCYALLRLGVVAGLEGDRLVITAPRDVAAFAERVGFRTLRRREALAVLTNRLGGGEADEAPLRFTRVAEVEPVPLSSGTARVYDLTVPGDETFLGGRGGLFFHNTFTVANVIERVQRPTLIIAHNKTLAAQLYGEFKELFPDNAVHYFVSYYDYYQPEAYVPSSDTYIEKDAQINEEIDRMRHAATSALLSRRDVVIVASVSCIYGLGDPEAYAASRLFLETGATLDRQAMLRKLVDIQYTRNDIDFARGTFRVRGDVVEIFPSTEEDRAVRVEFFGDDIESLSWIDPMRGKVLETARYITIPPGSHYVTPEAELGRARAAIREELRERLAYFREKGKLLEAQRLEERTSYDLEMLEQLGFCNGIENYSRHLTGRSPGDPPPTLIDYFPKDFLLVIDESHATVPQLGAMYRGDRSRKETLVEYGFRLPSALDNRPLKFEEFEQRANLRIYVSATPGPYELDKTQGVVIEQIIRPTGLLDPQLEVRPAANQIDDLLEEIRQRVAARERTLVTTLTKRMAEDLTEYYVDLGLKVRYMHADVETLERTAILRALRKGEFDILVGINLLREGLDLPEVSLVAILDADKEGFLRAERSLIQTFGRAARNVNGKVILYGDTITPSMRKAIDETDRRRALQAEYNQANGVTPRTVIRAITELEPGDPDADFGLVPEIVAPAEAGDDAVVDMDAFIAKLEKEMLAAADDLDFEKAAQLRDKIRGLQAVALGLRRSAGVAATAENPGWVNPWAHARKKRAQSRARSGGKRK